MPESAPRPMMNLILFTPDETSRPLPRADERARHIIETLRRSVGDQFDAGLVDGPRGKGRVDSIDAAALHLSFEWGEAPSPPPPLALIVGMPRPQTARDILRDATSLGVASMHFVATEKSDASFARSSLWRDGGWRRLLLAGAQQAFDTRLPAVTHGRGLAEVITGLDRGGIRLALDNYESPAHLSTAPLGAGPAATLAIGPERGWSASDRALLRGQGFDLVHLGRRVLRTETACIAAITLLRSRMGWA